MKRLGYEVKVVDLRCLNKHPSALASICDGYAPDIVGVSVHGVPNLLPARNCITICQRIWPEARVIAGGFMVKASPEYVRRHLPPGVQLFTGDSEVLGRSLDEALGGGRAEKISFPRKDFPGEPKVFSVPEIDCHDLISLGQHPLAPYLSSDFEIHLETQRGCPYRCRYCGTFPRGPNRILLREPGEVVEEMKRLLNQARGVRNGHYSFWITDETFTADKDHAHAFCESLLSEPVRYHWRAQTRADLVDGEILSLMKRAGCKQISFGIESLSDDVLKRVSKGVDAEDGMAALAMARKAGLSVRVILIIGLPGDSYSSVKRTFRLLESFKPDSCQLYIYHPVPGSPEFDADSGRANARLADEERELAHAGFLEAPAAGMGDLSRSDIVRWFLVANYVFPTRFNLRGDRRQLNRCNIGWRPNDRVDARSYSIEKIPSKYRLAFLEIAIASTGEFTREEVLERAQQISGLSHHEVEGILAKWPHFSFSLTSPDEKRGEERAPRLLPGVVLVRTSRGGLICDAFRQNDLSHDDLLRRTYVLSRHVYEIALRCIGRYGVAEVAYAVNRLCSKPRMTPAVVQEHILDLQKHGFIEGTREQDEESKKCVCA